jgi:dipeptidyl aminopeptidase/acylaminoacyl peptidase
MKLTRFAVAVVLFECAALAQQGFTLEQVLSSPFPTELVASPAGSCLAWVFDSQGRRNIWVAEGPQFQGRQLTSYNKEDGQEITNLQFTADGKSIVYVRGGNRNQAGEIPNPTSNPAGEKQAVWVVSVADGRIRMLGEGRSPVVAPAGAGVIFSNENGLLLASTATPGAAKPLFQARGNNGSPEWSPDARRVAFVSNRGNHSIIGIYDIRAGAIKWISPTVDRDLAPRWSPDGKRIAFIRQPATMGGDGMGGRGVRPWTIMIADAATGEARQIWRSPETPEASLGSGGGSLRWMADDRLIFVSEQDGWSHYYSLPAEGGEPVLLTPGACEVEHVTTTPDRRELIFSSNCEDIDRRHLWRVRVTGGAPEAITKGEKLEWSPAVTADAKQLAFFASDARVPAMPFVMPLSGGERKMIAAQALPKDFPSSQMVVPEQVLFKAADGLEIHGQLFLPAAAKSGRRLPAVIFMHGGPMRQMLLGWHYLYYYHNAYGFNQYLASRGYAVLSVNYRSGIGYGRAFREAQNRGARGASEYQDIVAGAQYLRTRSDIDPARIGLWGGSYGGYLTAMGLARNSDLFAAGVDLHGVHDWSTRVGGGVRAGGAGANLAGEAARLARDSSPVASISTWRSPVLLIQGDDDRNVDFGQMVDLVRRLRAQKVEFEQMVFPDEVHDFLLHSNWLKAYHAAVDFFDRKLRGN